MSAPKNSANNAIPTSSNASIGHSCGTIASSRLVAGVAVSVQNPVKVSGLTPYKAADTVPFDSRA
jgi:hypothetical protein